MKRCPQCGREYDLSMSFCLDDGAELLYGPGSGESTTAILQSADTASESRTALLEKESSTAARNFHNSQQEPASISSRRRSRSLLIGSGALALIVLMAGTGFLAYKYWSPTVPKAVPFESMKIERVTTNGKATQAVI